MLAKIKLATYARSMEALEKPLSAGELIDPFEEPEGLDFLAAPLDVRATSQEGGTRYDVHFGSEPLDKQRLFALLNHIAPQPEELPMDAAIGGVINDWNLVETQTMERGRGTRAGARQLVEAHQGLGDAWAEFMKSREAFMDVLDGYRPSFYTYNTPLLIEQDIEEHQIAKEHAWSPELDEAIFSQAFGSEDDSLRVEALQLFLKRAYNLTFIPEFAEETIAVSPDIAFNMLKTMDPRIREDILHDFSLSRTLAFFAEESSSEMALRHRYCNVAKELTFASATIDGAQVAVPRRSLVGTLAEQTERNPRSVVQIGNYAMTEVELTQEFNGREYATQAIAPGTERRIAGAELIEPRLNWFVSDDGKREFIIPRGFVHGEERRYIDGVLGVLAAAYLSPAVRERWPAKMKIPGHDTRFSQNMGPAQVPVMALFPGVQKNLLKSDFIAAAETVAH